MKQNKPSVRSILFFYLTIFTAIILIVLWLFQVVFLDSFYKMIRVQNIKKTSQTIENYINNGKAYNSLYNMCRFNDVSAYIIDIDGNIIYSIDAASKSILHNFSFAQLQNLINEAKENNGVSIQRYIDTSDADAGMMGSRFGRAESIVYTKIVTNKDSKDYAIIINANISPVDATVGTLRMQIIIITSIMLVVALILAFIMSKKITNPIISINKSSKELAKGNYDVAFEDNDYREISELGQTLNYASKELKKTEDLQRELIANISHDLRTPLTMIRGYAEVIRDLPGENTKENMQIIIDETQRLASLVADVMDISKIKSGVQELHSYEYDLTQSVIDIIDRYKKLIEQDGYDIEFKYDKHIFVNADELKISQVIYNLINNAVTYTGEDKKVIVNQTEIEDRVRISVIDTGEGIEEDKLAEIFDRYYKIDKSHKRAVVGTGLGLSIVKGILNLHDAKYGVTSEIGKGSEFYFELNKVDNANTEI
ncbi:MAG: HAMP domain-containing histidine kinase [Eubacteriaceae bacterium]|nr:HAMP domain-containing histidine kinase [Eubacteriaceae bacterium]